MKTKRVHIIAKKKAIHMRYLLMRTIGEIRTRKIGHENAFQKSLTTILYEGSRILQYHRVCANKVNLTRIQALTLHNDYHECCE